MRRHRTISWGWWGSQRSSGSPRIAVPAWVIAAGVLGAIFVTLPIVGLVTGVPWTHLGSVLTTPDSLQALWLSLRTASAATLLCLVLGTPLATVLARLRFPGRDVLRAVVLLPMVLPPVVAGLALLQAFGRRGLLGRYLEGAGVHIAFSTLAVVLAEAFVSMPFLVMTLSGALESSGVRHEQVAATLGASPWRVWRTVTLPRVLPSLITGTVLAFARSLGEFGATLTFAGSLPGVTRTLPLEIYLQREVDPGTALGLSLLLVGAALAVVLVAYGRRRPA